MRDELRREAIRIYDAFTHEHCDRRRLLRDMTAIAGTAAAAELLIASIGASPAAAQQVPADDPRLQFGIIELKSGDAALRGYGARPVGGDKLPRVMVVHENRGLTPHIQDVTRRLALEGFVAIAPDFLTPVGGTPEDEDRAREMIGKLDLAQTVELGVGALAGMRKIGNGKVGVIGFCWGGALVNRLAVAAGKGLDAGVAYYGPAPDPAEAVKVQAPMLLHYAGLDTRVAATGEPWVAALKAAGKSVEAYTYPGVDHAFNNDTSAERYNAPAATLAWQRTVGFLHKHL
jgi:carboxymethylenebutenolidase